MISLYIFQDFKGPKLKILYRILIRPQERAIFLYRLSSLCYKYHLKPFDALFWGLNVSLHSCDISRKAKIGPGFRLIHNVGIVIGPITAGIDLIVFQNVTIGYGGRSKKNKRHAIIGDNVIIYAGVVIAGNHMIGDNAEIGANAVVTKDIPSNSTSIGVPAVSKIKS